MASWVSAKLPATSTILIVTGLFGSAGIWAATGPQAKARSAAPSAAAATLVDTRQAALGVRWCRLPELMLFLLENCRPERAPTRCGAGCCDAVGAALTSRRTASAPAASPGRGRLSGMASRRLVGAFQAALKLAHDPGDMAVHRRASRFRIARFDRAQYDHVVANGLARQVGGVKVLLQASPQFGALLPQPGDGELERAVAGRLGDAEMEFAVARLAYGEILDVGLHSLHAAAQVIEVLRRNPRRRQRRDFALDELARLQQLEGPRAGVPGGGRLGSRRGDEDAAAHAHL